MVAAAAAGAAAAQGLGLRTRGAAEQKEGDNGLGTGGQVFGSGSTRTWHGSTAHVARGSEGGAAAAAARPWQAPY